MKKVLKRRGDISVKGLGLPNGTAMKVYKTAGYARLSFGGVVARRKESSEISIEEMTGEEIKETHREEIISLAAKVRKISVIFIIACLGVSLISIFIVQDLYRVIIGLGLMMTTFLIANKSTAKIILKVLKKGDYLSMSKYNGAVNTVINAYYDLERMPKMEELKNYSRCAMKNDEDIIEGMIFFIASLGSFIGGFGYFVWSFIIIGLFLIAIKTNQIYKLQAIVISKPDEEHLEVALKAFQEALEQNENWQISYKEIQISDVVEEMKEFAKDMSKFINTENCEQCKAKEHCLLYEINKELVEDD